jgi:hypothetical protein
LETRTGILWQFLKCKTDVLFLIKQQPSKERIRRKILSADIIYVGGGNTLQMMRVWRRLGVDKHLISAYENGAESIDSALFFLLYPRFGHKLSLLAQYLKYLSTSAPAPSVRVYGKVPRRGTCDRGILTKSLAFAADAEELIFLYGFPWLFRHLIARGVPKAGSLRAGVQHNDVYDASNTANSCSSENSRPASTR